ncbi:MAG: VOC family protein [Sphingomonadales bacterium]
MSNHHGDFIWYELMTSDGGAAHAFYGPMLDWRFGGNDEYREIEGSDGAVGGILQLTPEMTSGGARPCWVGYILVDDVDRMVESIEHGGGKTFMPPRSLEGIGRFAMVADPQGAAFYVMKPIPPADKPDMTSNAFSYDRQRPGHCAWNELSTTDPAAALHFYGQRFGWVKDGEMDMGPMGKYEFIRHAGRAPDGSLPGQGMLGAVMPKMPQMPVSGWTYYFRVADVDAAVAHIAANGGTVTLQPTEIPGGEFSMNAIDPQGAHFALVGKRSA